MNNPFGFAFQAFRRKSTEKPKDMETILKEFEAFFDMNDKVSQSTARQQGKGVIKGRDVQLDITLTFEEAALGCTKEVSYVRNEVCQTCDGTGSKPGSRETTCKTCNGKGYIVEERRMYLSALAQIECEVCEGLGVVRPACTTCSGVGALRVETKQQIKIPPGVYSGLVLRNEGKGNEVQKGVGVSGDLLLKVKVEDHAEFRREGLDILSTVEVPFSRAVFGGTVSVQTLKGRKDVKINAGTKSGSRVVIKGAGI